jgi:hypothetical protein
MSATVVTIGVILPTLIVGLFAYFTCLTSRKVSAARVLGNLKSVAVRSVKPKDPRRSKRIGFTGDPGFSESAALRLPKSFLPLAAIPCRCGIQTGDWILIWVRYEY